MSLILDALRKADAERERGSVPSLHSHPVVPLAAEVPPKARASAWTWIGAAGVIALTGAAVAWMLVGRDAPPPGIVTATPPTAAVVAPGSVPPAVTPPSTPPAAVAPALPILGGGVAPPPTVGAPPAAEPAPWPQVDERKTASAEARPEAPVRVLGNVPPAEAPIHSRDQLPPDIRAQLPSLTIGGSIYSPNPAGRSLIVNGQLFREKDRLTQDLSLEEIRLKAAIFSFRGYRFEVLF